MHVSVRKLAFALTSSAVFLVACAEPDPNYGDPNGIINQRLPNEGEVATGAGGVFGAPYDANANKPTTTFRAAHQAKGGPAVSDAPLACTDCHKAGGAAKDKVFAFGGRVVKSAPVPNVDVIVTGPEKLGPVKSDDDGFFWLLGAELKTGAKVTVRNASGESAMNTQPQSGCDASGCHVPTGQGRVGKGLP